MNQTKPMRAPDLLARKVRGEKISMLTAYDAAMARLFDQAGIDVLLVGDSLGMAVYGHEDTLQVRMDDIVRHTQAVRRGARRALIVADLPFFSYQISAEEAMRNAARLVQEGGAMVVKLEGGVSVAATAERIVAAGVPVMGHVGLLPQSVHAQGGFKRQGVTADGRRRILADAAALESAGACAIVLECVPEELAAEITAKLRTPTIGIGSGTNCDGQVLVSYDILGLSENPPPFAPRYAHLDREIVDAARAFSEDVKAGARLEERIANA